MKYKDFLLTNKKYVLILLIGVILLVAGNIKLPKAKDTNEEAYLNKETVKWKIRRFYLAQFSLVVF